MPSFLFALRLVLRSLWTRLLTWVASRLGAATFAELVGILNFVAH